MHVACPPPAQPSFPKQHCVADAVALFLRPYIKDAQRILTRAREFGHARITQSKLNFLHLAIIDGSITTDGAISRLADDCCDRVRAGEKLYIHCWGGHGRTGTLVNMPPLELLVYVLMLPVSMLR